MAHTPKLVRPNFYHRPVAAVGESESYDEKISAVLRQIPRHELRDHAETVLTFDADEAGHEARTYESRDDYYRHMEYLEAITKTKARFWAGPWHYRYHQRVIRMFGNWVERRKLQRRSNFNNRQSVDCMRLTVLSGFEWHPDEGSRYPARYEPVYAHYAVTAAGLYKADAGTGVWIRYAGLTAREQATIWVAAH